eukprot:scaffold66079_cov60-Phaeocystis_antarctica.AAC.6
MAKASIVSRSGSADNVLVPPCARFLKLTRFALASLAAKRRGYVQLSSYPLVLLAEPGHPPVIPPAIMEPPIDMRRSGGPRAWPPRTSPGCARRCERIRQWNQAQRAASASALSWRGAPESSRPLGGAGSHPYINNGTRTQPARPVRRRGSSPLARFGLITQFWLLGLQATVYRPEALLRTCASRPSSKSQSGGSSSVHETEDISHGSPAGRPPSYRNGPR